MSEPLPLIKEVFDYETNGNIFRRSQTWAGYATDYNVLFYLWQCNELAADENDDVKASVDDCQDPEDYDHDYDEDEDEDDTEDSLLTKIKTKIRAFFNPLRIMLVVLLLCGFTKAMIGRHVISVAKLGLGGVRIGEEVIRKVKGEKRILTYDAAMNLVDTTK